MKNSDPGDRRSIRKINDISGFAHEHHHRAHGGGLFQQDLQTRINDQKLTEREKSVLDQLANGLMYKEIAVKAGISTETVRDTTRNIYEKLHVGSRMEAIRKVYPRRT